MTQDDHGPEAGRADYNLRILWPLARYVEDRVDAATLERLARASGLEAADFDGKSRWVSAEALEGFLARARELVPDEDAFKAACAYRIVEAYGPLRYLLWAASPAMVYRQAVRTYRMVSTVGDPSILGHGPTHLHMRITSTRPISRMNCLLRQAQTAALPTIWGLPKAHVREEGCLAFGDQACDLHFRWYDTRRWLPSVGAAAVVGLLGAFAHQAGWIGGPLLAIIVLVTAIAGYVYERERNERTNAGTREEVMDALRQLATHEAEARREILELHQRQKDWSRILEENAAEKAATIQDIVDRVEGLQQARESTLRGFSHDLRNPLAVVQASAEYLRDNVDALGEEGPLLVKDLDWSILNMKRMLAELMELATSQKTFVQLVPQKMDVNVLVGRVRRRLAALTHGKKLRVKVTAARTTPESIEIDPLLFDRVVDNLLTNAIKYTVEGSINVDVDGTSSYLTVKVSDTGRGIEADQFEKIFSAGGSDPRGRAKDSYGVGLSVVTQLLDQVGGRLEVMSEPKVGTTFWVHFPMQHQRSVRPAPLIVEKGEKALFSRVVTVRSCHA